jgi:hypothetical protein
MKNETKLMKAVKAYRDNLELEAELERINDQIEENAQLIIKHFFPYLLSVYKKWKPRLRENVVCLDLENQRCFEVTIKNIDGNSVRGQIREADAYYRFELNPSLEKYETANFIIPKWSYEEVKDLFQLRLII